MKLPIFLVNCLLLLLAINGWASDDFDRLMGKETGTFQYVQTPEDFRRLNFYREIFDKEIQQLTTGRGAIPKIFHLIWLGPGDFPAKSVHNLKKWRKDHPSWKMKFWTDLDRAPPIEGMEKHLLPALHFLESEYHQTENYGEKAKILAFEILFQEGGVYIDPGAAFYRAIDPLNESYHFYCGLEKLGPSILSTSVFPTTRLMAAAPAHPILLETMEWLKSHFQDLGNQFPGTGSLAVKNRVDHRTLWALSEGIEKGIGRSGGPDIIFPTSYLSGSGSLQRGEWTRHFTSFETKVTDQLGSLVSEENEEVWTAVLLAILSIVMIALLAFKMRRTAALVFLFAVAGLNASEFDRYMGDETAHWAHVTEKQDIKLLEKCRNLYEKNIALSKAKEGPYKIPPKVHFIWLGPNPFPPGSVENVRTWIAHHPDWEVIFWTDRDRSAPCEGMEVRFVQDFPFLFLKERFEESTTWGEKSDVLRYEILYQLGGTYVDHDANCLIRFDGLHRGYDFYCGLEAPHPPFAGRNITSGIGVLGARASHPMILKVMNLIENHWEALGHKYPGRDGYSRTQLVMERTYMALTHLLSEDFEEEGRADIVFPSAYFFAKKGIPSLYSKHFYANTWADEGKGNSTFEKMATRSLGRARRRGATALWIMRGAIGINLAALIVVLTFRRKRRI